MVLCSKIVVLQCSYYAIGWLNQTCLTSVKQEVQWWRNAIYFYTCRRWIFRNLQTDVAICSAISLFMWNFRHCGILAAKNTFDLEKNHWARLKLIWKVGSQILEDEKRCLILLHHLIFRISIFAAYSNLFENKKN